MGRAGSQTDPTLSKSIYVTGSTLTFHNVRYTVQVKNPDKFCGTISKEILKGINGIFQPGMNAIMGPTGGGKSSLLDVLAGRKDPLGLSGTVLVDGQPQPKNFKYDSGYVVQDDIVMGTLTVRENIMFSANIRLPNTVSNEEKKKRVEDIVGELGLADCADTKIGSEFVKGISGGERKRAMIGIELVIVPTVLFLDEPTTGLDANTANSIIRLLHSIARKGRTVIFSIHQPRFAIFKLFDRLTLLGKGTTVYHGPAGEALDFFSSIGYDCDAFNNPADFFLDVISGDYSKTRDHCVANQGSCSDTKVNCGYPHSANDSVAVVRESDALVVEIKDTDSKSKGSPNSDPSAELADAFEQSDWKNKVHIEIDPVYELFKQGGSSPSDAGSDTGYATSFLTQLRHLSKRSLINMYRNPLSSLMQWSTAVLCAFMTGIIYYQMDRSYPDGIQNRSGAFFFIILVAVFANLSALELFITERILFVHENVSGFYRVSAYFMSKVFCDIIPMRVVPMIPFTAITYFMIDLDSDVRKFFIYTLIVTLTSLAASSIGFLCGAIFRLVGVANTGVALIYTIMMIFGGMLINVNGIVFWLRWLQYLSLFRYAMKALSINELKHMNFYQSTSVNGTTTKQALPVGNQYLKEQHIDYNSDWDLWQNMLAIFLLFVAVLTLSYIQLRRIKKLK